MLERTRSHTVPLYFLLGECRWKPCSTSMWCHSFGQSGANPQAKVYAIVQYLLTTADDKSLTWSVHLRLIFRKYNLLDPLTLLQSNVWPKTKWKTYSKTLITAYHEKQLREKARSNINLKYFNVTVSGLSGRRQPVLANTYTAYDVERSRVRNSKQYIFQNQIQYIERIRYCWNSITYMVRF